MTDLSQIVPYLLTAPAMAYSLLTLWGAASHCPRKRGVPRTLLPATVIKPVKGADPDSYDNFASFCCQRYETYQLIFALASADDPAVPVIRRLMADFPAVDISLVIDDRVYGPNAKVAHLVNALPQAKYDIILICDSDVRVGPVWLEKNCAPFADPKVGLVTSLYRATGVGGSAGALEALGYSTEMVPNVLAALLLEGLTFALGASMAVRRQALQAIGGFEPLAQYLADDYQLGNRVFRAGYRLALAEGYVECVIGEERLASVVARQLRWSRTMRVSRPRGYLASGVTLPGVAAGAALLAGGLQSGLTAVLVMYVMRMVTATLFSARYVRDGLLPGYLWLLPVRDLLAAVSWALAFAGSEVIWRGQRFRLQSDGSMEEVAE